MDGAGQKLERRFRLIVWTETDQWMQARCADLNEADRNHDAASVFLEFRIRESA